MDPDVSIIIPVYNRPRLVREAIASALEGGGLLRREVIVVDDASTDETWEAVRSLGDSVRAIRLPRNAGQGGARNAGLDAATGRYVKFLDSDDLLVAAHLQREVDAARTEGADIVVSGWGDLLVDGRRRESAAPQFDSVVDDLLAGRSVPTSAALYARGRAARWDTALPKLADWDFFVQSALGASKIVTVPGTAYWLREHRGARVSSTTMLENARAHHRILRKIEDRLASEGKLSAARRLRLAQYFYKELRVLSLYDRTAFAAALAHIFELDPHFAPRQEERQWWMRVLARAIGTRGALLAHSALKRALGRSR